MTTKELKLPLEVRNYFRDANRISRHGDASIVLKAGRKPVSEEHKKETRRKYKEKLKLNSKPKLKQGRPRKMVLPSCIQDVQDEASHSENGTIAIEATVPNGIADSISF